jgi:chromosome segregation ATPase
MSTMGETLNEAMVALKALLPHEDRLDDIEGAIAGARKELAMVNAKLAKAKADLTAVLADRDRAFDSISSAKGELTSLHGALGAAHKEFDHLTRQLNKMR